MLKISLEAKLFIFVFVLIISSLLTMSILMSWLENIYLTVVFSSLILMTLGFIAIRYFMGPINRVLSALNDGFYNFLDNDFSVSIAHVRNDELGELCKIYNRVGEVLRGERLHLYQRELLLDTVIQTTPLSLVLIDDTGVIIYSNNAAKQLFNQGAAINGLKFKILLDQLSAAFLTAVNSGLSGLFTSQVDDSNETYHLTQNQFLLNGRQHQLYLFKTLTKEINRQEVNIWKKVIRVISHELNNSLAPIKSLAHSGQLISSKQNDQKLADIFETMGERAGYLQSFIEGYAKFSRLPRPQLSQVECLSFFHGLQKIQSFELDCPLNIASIYCDPAQMQQVIINFIKNAHESGSPIEDIKLSIRVIENTIEIKIRDRGKGMSETNLANALLPFYSTKAGGSGLGLPLCREIIEAHGGKMAITNRKNGGILISLQLPNLNPEH